ncbi:hypothetical protein GCM10010964_22800 [Caldovatus sediminis]|uniref:Uncharacterized protein n=1 Tax=Caldovatus sediminis TaxID=2041189 RepID=A0A8J2ZBH0_9PROT|nr:hypothetical protein GCM10010964_22800 [Caldovatus sediminis]
MLAAVCGTACAYMRVMRATGCDAAFFSINGAIVPPNPRGVDQATFRAFLRPCARRMPEGWRAWRASCTSTAWAWT